MSEFIKFYLTQFNSIGVAAIAILILLILLAFSLAKDLHKLANAIFCTILTVFFTTIFVLSSSHFEIDSSAKWHQLYHKYGQMKEDRIVELTDKLSSIEFTLNGKLSHYWSSSEALTVDDLIKYEALDESKVVYLMCYDFAQDSYSTQYNLLSVCSSFEKLQEQINQIKSSSQIITIDDIDVIVVPIDQMQNAYLCAQY